MRCSPLQLLELERCSPHIVPLDSEIWKIFTLRDFRDLADDYHAGIASEPLSWRDTYTRHAAERDKKMKDASAKLRNSYKKLGDAKSRRALIFTTSPILSANERATRKRKLATAITKPKTIMDKARKETKVISGMYRPPSTQVRRQIFAPVSKPATLKTSPKPAFSPEFSPASSPPLPPQSHKTSSFLLSSPPTTHRLPPRTPNSLSPPSDSSPPPSSKYSPTISSHTVKKARRVIKIDDEGVASPNWFVDRACSPPPSTTKKK